MKTTTADFHYVTEALQAGTDCVWSLLDKEGANNVDDVLALLATGQTIADEALGRLTAAAALAEAMEPLSHFLDTFKNVADNLALWFYSDGKEVVTVGDFRRVVEALREYREVSRER